jgi:hypothetical protein
MDPKQSRIYCCANDSESVANHILGGSTANAIVRLSAAAGGRLEIKAASGEAVTSSPGSENNDIDGCDLQVEVATLDEDLPEAEGGVA